MEITDVSQPDHAEARFIPDVNSGGKSPQVSDLATVPRKLQDKRGRSIHYLEVSQFAQPAEGIRRERQDLRKEGHPVAANCGHRHHVASGVVMVVKGRARFRSETGPETTSDKRKLSDVVQIRTSTRR